MLQQGMYKALCEDREGVAVHFAWVFGENKTKSQEVRVKRTYKFSCKWQEEHSGKGNDIGEIMEYLACWGLMIWPIGRVHGAQQ